MSGVFDLQRHFPDVTGLIVAGWFPNGAGGVQCPAPDCRARRFVGPEPGLAGGLARSAARLCRDCEAMRPDEDTRKRSMTMSTAMKTELMFSTRNDLDQAVREDMISLLNQQLADTFDLYSQTKQAHWNVKGSLFFQLHELFDKLAAELLVYADTIAERATALGGLAEGTVRMSAAGSQLPELELEVTESLAIVEALAQRYAALGRSLRQAIDSAEGQGDADTADLFTEVSRGVDKALWFLEAHLQSQR
jgi:starvation-inducible DNA-binding protein